MKIIETNDSVIIDGYEISGFIDYGRKCPTCKKDVIYADEYDTLCCVYCNEWLEKACDDEDCDYCASRPSAPIPTSVDKRSSKEVR